MVCGSMDFTTAPSFENRSVLKVTTPKGVYNDKQSQELYRQVKDQVGNEYLVVVVPDDVQLEIIM